MKISICLFVCFLAASVESICPANTICRKARDNIVQSDSSVTGLEKNRTRSRTWLIKPDMQPFNLVLSFKNFSSSVFASVVVISHEPRNTKKTEYYYGDLGSFEVVLENTVGAIIYVPIRVEQTPSFELDYYAGCSILRRSQFQINFPMPGPLSTPGIRAGKGPVFCWVFNPASTDSRSQIYFSLRNVALSQGQSLTIKDVRTSEQLAKIESYVDFRALVVESQEDRPIMIEFTCSQNVCDLTETAFNLRYYAMDDEDIQCIETQKYCSNSNYTMPAEMCDAKCPALDNLLAQEFQSNAGASFFSTLGQGNQIMLRSGQVKKKSDKKLRPCPIDERFCMCEETDLMQYCGDGVECFRKKGCTVRCIFARFLFCEKPKILQRRRKSRAPGLKLL